MYGDEKIKTVLVTEEQIIKRCKELGAQITKDYANHSGNLLLVGLLKGSVSFMSEIIKRIELPIHIDFMDVSSYDGTESRGDIKINKDLNTSVKGVDILLIEDIVDTGTTIFHVKELLYNKRAREVKVCSLLDKPDRRKVEVKADYVGFEIPNEFVVGFGLDYDQDYRNLPYVGVLKEELYSK